MGRVGGIRYPRNKLPRAHASRGATGVYALIIGIFQAVEAQEVLTLDRRYFQLAKPLERRLYELARKHAGQQPSFTIGLEKLRNKSGSQSTLKEFRRLLQSIIKDDSDHNHMPGYSFHLDGEMVEMRRKTGESPPPLPGPSIRLKTETYEGARALAPGCWDVHAIEADWRDWITKKSITPWARRPAFPGVL